MNQIKSLHRVLALSAVLAIFATGCGTTERHDPAKAQAVKDALQAPIERAVARVILNSPKHADELAGYFRAAGAVFCEMKETGQLDPTTLIAGLDRVFPPEKLAKLGDDFQYLLDFKSTAAALYKQFFNDRFRAELPPDQWPYHVADFFCVSIDSGLKSAGKPGIR